MSFLRRLLNVGRSSGLSRDIQREIDFHVSERIDALRAEGLSADEAERRARRQFGNPTFQKERTRDADIVAWLDSFVGDVRYGMRALRRTPVFTTVAVLSLALGIGANTAIFSLIDAVVLRPLPVPRPEELVQITSGDAGEWYFTNPLWEEVRNRQTGLAAVTAFAENEWVSGEGADARRLNGQFVSGDFFEVFGVQPVLGRLPAKADDVRGCPGTAVLSYQFWYEEYGGRPNVVGQTINLEGKPFEIVGVTAQGFAGPLVGQAQKLFVPLCAEAYLNGTDGSRLDRRSNWWLRVIGRRDPALDVAQVSARLHTIAPATYAATLPAAWSAEMQKDYLTRTLNAYPAQSGFSQVRSRYSKALYIMMGAVGLVLLIACANVANLLLARAASRHREIAIRLAVGAGRRRLIRQLITEGAMLAAAGAIAGLFIASWGTRALVALISSPPDLMVSLDTSLNVQVLSFTAAIAAATVTLFGLVPAWRGTRVSPQAAMKANGRGVAEGHGRERFTLSKALVVAQVALSLTLLVGSALLIGSLRNLNNVDPGFRARGVLIVTANFRAGITGERLAGLRAELLTRVRALPGVRSASTSDMTPIAGSTWNGDIVVDGFTPKSGMDAIVWFNQVSDGYFQTLDTRLIAGRDFDATDVPGGPRTVIVNASLAKKFFPSGSAVGRQFRQKMGDSLTAPLTVVGVVADAKYRNLRETNSETAYLAASQDKYGGHIVMEVRSDGDPLLLIPSIKKTVEEIHRSGTTKFTSLDEQVAGSLQRERVLAVLSGLFGAVALALAMLGLYGVMTYTVARRRNEIGVRIALGADRARVLGMVLGDVARVVAIGLVIGAASAAASGKLVTSFLYELTPSDPSIMGLAAAVLAVVALGAGLAPALRASRVDPVAALRED